MTVRNAPAPRVVRVFPASVLARVTGANVRTAERWRTGQSPQARFRDRMTAMQSVLDALGRGMTDPAKRAWLEAPNPALRWDRPADRLARGDYAAVMAAAESYTVGDYA